MELQKHDLRKQLIHQMVKPEIIPSLKEELEKFIIPV